MSVCAKVHILDVPYHADCEYTYFIPVGMRDEVTEGSVVAVPFGNANRQKSAIVVSLCEEQDLQGIKPISSVMSDYLKLNSELLSLCAFMKEQTLCTFGEAVRCILPSAIISKTREYFTPNLEKESSVPDAMAELYGYIKENPDTEYDRLKRKFGDCDASLSWLFRNKYISKRTEIVEDDKNKYRNVISLALDKETALCACEPKNSFGIRSEKQKNIIRLLCEYESISDKEIYERTSTSKAQLDPLIKKGIVKSEKVEIYRNPYENKAVKNNEQTVLSEIQKNAFEQLKALYKDKEPRAALLYGVTGSGKTSVIKKMIDEVISDGKGVIILVPEISLTPQTVSIFCGYYGDRVAIIHSSLSAGERFDTYKKIFDGKADIVIGTRSAVFAPLKNIGMIVIDEEQEHTYKSDTDPKYLAHDIARFRCAKSGGLMLLASATPSFNSYYKAMGGTYSLVKLTERYGGATLPDVIITDMRKERIGGNVSAFGGKLISLMSDAKQRGKQAILFLNRRGYFASVGCQNCGKPIQCPHCSVAMTYHSFGKIKEEITAENATEILSKNGVLRCHYCGYQTRLPEKCSECGEKTFNYVGFGTQKAQEELTELFPEISTLRLDADTTSSKFSYEKILGSFREGEADVLIGTQMVTKGHDFPSVTLVGVMLADTMLYTSDYRSAERTFSMLTQVVGRAGRAKDKGVAVIQTNAPNEKTILLAAKQDYESFYKNEIEIRKAYTFPPFCDIALFSLSAEDERSLNESADGLLKKMRSKITNDIPVIVYGPFEAPIYKAQGRYRKRILIKCKLNRQIRKIFSDIYSEFTKSSGKVRLSVDFNPSSL